MTVNPVTVSTRARTRTSPLIGSAAFLLIYLAVSPVADAIAPLPLPDAPIEDVYTYFTDHGAASIATGVLQLLSVSGFGLFLAAGLRFLTVPRLRQAAQLLGWIAVLAMLVSCAVAIILPLAAPALSPENVETWRQVSFYAGGVVHVVALGGTALSIAVGRDWTTPVRVMAWIAAVPALLSVSSLFFYYASILLPAGRLLTMIAFIVAAISLARGRSLTAGASTLR